MSARRVRQLLAATAVTGVVALVPASAGAHPGGVRRERRDGLRSPRRTGSRGWTVRRRGMHERGGRPRPRRLRCGARGGRVGAGTDNLELLSSAPKPAPFEAEGDFNSDLAFENGYAFGGNYDGVQIWDVRNGHTPALASVIHCPGSQNDVTVNDGILVTSTDSIRNKPECEGNVSLPSLTARSTASRRTGRACGSSTSATRTGRSTWERCRRIAARTPTRCCPSATGC